MFARMRRSFRALRPKSREIAGLRAALQDAQAALRAKSDFLAHMSHEIRTPMNGVLGYAQLLLDSELADEQRQFAELIAESARSMTAIVNDILDLSRIEAGQMPISEEVLDLRDAIEGALRPLRAIAAHKGLALECEIDPALPRQIVSDRLRLQQILANLLGNAVKFTEHGAIHLVARRDGPAHQPSLWIAVIDSGIGIPPERQAAIFEDFVQAECSTHRRFGGTGLGLAISRRLAHLMHGQLELQSTPGQGSCFHLTLPLKLPESPAPFTAPPGPTLPATRKARILVAEDHDINQLLITRLIRHLGHEVTLAPDGAAALRMVSASHDTPGAFDLVLMDLRMPEMDGLEAARAIRSMGISAAQLPIIALSANAFPTDRENCLRAGMQDHVPKPVEADRLARAIACHLPGHAGRAAPRPDEDDAHSRLRGKYLAMREETLAALAAWLSDREPLSQVEHTQIVRQLHKLAGSAALFGDAALGIQAAALEDGLRAAGDNVQLRAMAMAMAGHIRHAA